ncbi:type II toxin-antitoxin system VapC family toxin [Thiocystis violacea]|uniref:type II toxin-antitoxin system VapC family toxin n=1 Tax=Thiocystis violacea TaxID=13725 RepID=UPI001907A681|nr:type II toxin-antitoxin system VapC family toxin [Thiocystis violacea]MBK1725032.1 VapC toxin family PIN domain ribonuclease [Thiocystis violacea]
MGFLIDTNVLSEVQKGERADAGVRAWYDAADPSGLYLSVLVIGEVRQGIDRLRRRDPVQAERLEQRLALIKEVFAEHILPVSAAVAERWGHNNVPDALPVIDGLLAATAQEHGLTLVTRNVRDVERSGVSVLNPFSDASTP